MSAGSFSDRHIRSVPVPVALKCLLLWPGAAEFDFCMRCVYDVGREFSTESIVAADCCLQLALPVVGDRWLRRIVGLGDNEAALLCF